MRYFSVFSGIEAASVAWEPLGWEPLLFSEIDEFPSAVLKARFPRIPNLGDIAKIDWKEAVNAFGRPDLVVGGSPCQSFSIAGVRTGLEGASGLMWEYVRCVREVMPDWVLWENVPGALSSTHGEDFRCLLEALDAIGYGLAWRVLDAEFFGLAQRRERVFVVGCLGDVERPCKVLFEPESLRWDTPSSREKRKELAGGAGRGAEAAGSALNPADPQSKRVYDPSGCGPTLNSGTGEGMNIQPSVLTAGFRWHQGSGAGAVGYEGEQSPTLDTVKPPAICMTDTQPNSMVDSDICGALTATMHKDPPVTMQVRCGSEGGGKGALIQTDMSATLSTVQTQTLFQPVAFAQNTRDEVRLQGGDGDVSGALSANPGMKQTTYVAQGYAVRRLTPRECERLQGFPDDWTKVPYRGKPADECPDTPRYKAIGNSMAVSVMRWLGKRIEMVEGETRCTSET